MKAEKFGATSIGDRLEFHHNDQKNNTACGEPEFQQLQQIKNFVVTAFTQQDRITNNKQNTNTTIQQLATMAATWHRTRVYNIIIPWLLQLYVYECVHLLLQEVCAWAHVRAHVSQPLTQAHSQPFNIPHCFQYAKLKG